MSIEANETVLDQLEQLGDYTENPFTVEQQPLRENVKESLRNYFDKLGSSFVNDLYNMVLSEVEKPLLDAVMDYARGNQSKAAIMLGLSRGTLRKKLKIYGFID